jgi:organic hydroperoxide reductase OsmC/OhrA
MSEYKVSLAWKFDGQNWSKGQYSREHAWSFDNGQTLLASASPSIVQVPYSNPAGIDPEEAMVAAIASCHMLSFLHVARLQGFQVNSYDDDAVGVLTKNGNGKLWLSKTTLSPRVAFDGPTLPTPQEQEHLHHVAHEECFIANSVRTEIVIKGCWE